MTDAPLASPDRAPPARRPSMRENRRLRILAMVQDGCSNAEIGRQEGLSRERVRQIVAEAVDAKGRTDKLVHARVQIARLEPALRLAARSIVAGDLGAIDRLLRVLDRLDKYAVTDAVCVRATDETRRKLLAKLDRMAEAMIAQRKRKEAAAAAAAAAAGVPFDPDSALDTPDPLETQGVSSLPSWPPLDPA